MSSFWQALARPESKPTRFIVSDLGQVVIPHSGARMTRKVISHGPRDKKQIALTFDADMTPAMKVQLDTHEVETYYNKKVVDILTETQTKATLFLSGMWADQYPDVTYILARNPLFELANHSYSHPSFEGECFGLTPLADGNADDEIQKTQQSFKTIAGITPSLFRFPGGCHDEADDQLVWRNGLHVIQWDVAGQDGFNEEPHVIEQNVLQNVKNGSIIVLHMHGGPNAPRTADALPKIISELKARGFSFVTVSELLNPQKQPLEFVSYNY